MTTETRFAIAMGDNARAADMPAISYACVEGARIEDIIKFQFPYLNKYKGAEIEVHLSAGHCDIVQATLKNHRKLRSDEAMSENFDTEMNIIIRKYTDLILDLRGNRNATLVLYKLRDPKEYTPICANLRPLAPFYELGVRQLNAYIKGWGSKLNFATIAPTN